MKGSYLYFIVLGFLALFFCGCDGENKPPETYKFTILQTTDMHNHVSGYGVQADYSPLSANDDDVLGGYARIGEQIQEIRSEQAKSDIPVLVVDSGDFTMGTIYDLASTVNPPSLLFFQMAQYDVITLGNHEFDYSPLGLYAILDAGINEGGFDIPIVATNMVTDGITGTSDDGLEALEANGTIQKSLVLTLSNGLKIGIIGLMGPNADSYAPAAPPVTFDHSYTDIQAAVDDLRNNQGAQIVVALSHSGVIDPNGTPKGDDLDLADNVTGIDIIASGHEHQTTQTLLTENGTFIFCAGAYGTNLARLDVTYYAASQEIDTPNLTNIPIDDSFTGSPWMQTQAFDLVDQQLDTNIQALDPNLSLTGELAVCQTDNVSMPHNAEESGMGNLVADAVRYTLQPAVALGYIPTPTVGLVGQGVIRSGFAYGQTVSLADMYAVLPLGMTPATDQAVTMPGYPLMQVYLTGAEIQHMCQFVAYVIASQDSTFTGMLAAGNDQQKQLYGALSQLTPEYYMNLSGVQFTHAGITGGYQVTDVKMYANDDYQCVNEPTAIQSEMYYPCVVDIYALMLVQSTPMQTLLNGLGIPVSPKYNANPTDPTQPDFQVISTNEELLSTRLDSSPDALGGTAGIQEVKEWQAFLNYLTQTADVGGLNSVISDSYYGTNAMGRVKTP